MQPIFAGCADITDFEKVTEWYAELDEDEEIEAVDAIDALFANINVVWNQINEQFGSVTARQSELWLKSRLVSRQRGNNQYERELLTDC